MKSVFIIAGKILLSIMIGILLFAISVRFGAHILPPSCNGGLCPLSIITVLGGFPFPIESDIKVGLNNTNIAIDISFWVAISYVAIEFISRKIRSKRIHN